MTHGKKNESCGRGLGGLKVYGLALGFAREARPLHDKIRPVDPSAADHLRRAVASQVLNIAEGAGRRTLRERAKFLDIARGSARECQAVLDLAVSWGILRAREVERALDLSEQVVRILTAMILRA